MGASRAALPARLLYDRYKERTGHRRPDVSKGASAALGEAKREQPCVRRLLQSAASQVGSEVGGSRSSGSGLMSAADTPRAWHGTWVQQTRPEGHDSRERWGFQPLRRMGMSRAYPSRAWHGTWVQQTRPEGPRFVRDGLPSAPDGRSCRTWPRPVPGMGRVCRGQPPPPDRPQLRNHARRWYDGSRWSFKSAPTC
jgi:hypothetical protein